MHYWVTQDNVERRDTQDTSRRSKKHRSGPDYFDFRCQASVPGPTSTAAVRKEAIATKLRSEIAIAELDIRLAGSGGSRVHGSTTTESWVGSTGIRDEVGHYKSVLTLCDDRRHPCFAFFLRELVPEKLDFFFFLKGKFLMRNSHDDKKWTSLDCWVSPIKTQHTTITLRGVFKNKYKWRTEFFSVFWLWRSVMYEIKKNGFVDDTTKVEHVNYSTSNTLLIST